MKPITITVPGRREPIELEAHLILNGLAVTVSLDTMDVKRGAKKDWNLTHLKSGCHMPAARMLSRQYWEHRVNKRQALAILRDLVARGLPDLSEMDGAQASEVLKDFIP